MSLMVSSSYVSGTYPPRFFEACNWLDGVRDFVVFVCSSFCSASSCDFFRASLAFLAVGDDLRGNTRE